LIYVVLWELKNVYFPAFTLLQQIFSPNGFVWAIGDTVEGVSKARRREEASETLATELENPRITKGRLGGATKESPSATNRSTLTEATPNSDPKEISDEISVGPVPTSPSGSRCRQLGPPPEEDKPKIIPESTGDVVSSRREHPRTTIDTRPASSNSDIVSCRTLDEWETLVFDIRQARRKPECFQPKPVPVNWRRNFLTTRPKAKSKPMPSLLHVCTFELLKFEFEHGGSFLPNRQKFQSLSKGSN
jgi:hypothetical protein